MNAFWTSALQMFAGMGRSLSGAILAVSLMFAASVVGLIFFPEKFGDLMFCLIGWLVIVVPLVVIIAICRNYFKRPSRVPRSNLSSDELSKIRAKLLKTNSWKKS
jgi:hypothetical protein